MKIKKVKLNNYRGFKEFELDIPDNHAVILGANASGKTAILEAMSICIGTILIGFDGVSSSGIKKTDVRQEYYKLGSVGDVQLQYPVVTACEMEIDDELFDFSRRLNKAKGRTTKLEAENIITYFSKIDKEIKSGSEKVILPLISYYSTGRLWLHTVYERKQTRNKYEMNIKDDESNYRFNRLNGYTDCLSARSNEKLMLKWFENMEYISFQKKKNIPELDVVKRAIAEFYARSLEYNINVQEIIVEFDSILNQLVIEHLDGNGDVKRLPFGILSDGYKIMLSMVADIAYRMATLNPQLLEKTLVETKGIVMIDEIDMHLHPKWQRHVIEDLNCIFPNIQFIFTTHSEHVISNIDQNHIIKLDANGIRIDVPPTKGRDINSLTLEIMDLPIREESAQELIDLFYEEIDCGQLSKAKITLDEMIELFGENDSEVIKASVEYSLEVG